MTPPALAERAEATANAWDKLRRYLSDVEWEKFNFQVFEARKGSTEDFQHLLESWIITVAMRENPQYSEQYDGFMSALRTV